MKRGDINYFCYRVIINQEPSLLSKMFQNWNKFTATLLIHSASIDGSFINSLTSSSSSSSSILPSSGEQKSLMIRAVFCQDGKDRSATTVFKELEHSNNGLQHSKDILVANFEQEIKIRVKFRKGANGTLIARDFSLFLETFRHDSTSSSNTNTNTKVQYLYEELCRSSVPLSSYFLDKRNENTWNPNSVISLPLKKVSSSDTSNAVIGSIRFQIRFQELFEETLGDKLVNMVITHKSATQIKEEVSHEKKIHVETASTLSSESSPNADEHSPKTLERRSLKTRNLASLITGGIISSPTIAAVSPTDDKLEQRCKTLEKELLEAREEQTAALAKEVQLTTECDDLRRRCAELEKTVDTLYTKVAQFYWERDEDHDACMNELCRNEFTLFNRRYSEYLLAL